MTILWANYHVKSTILYLQISMFDAHSFFIELFFSSFLISFMKSYICHSIFIIKFSLQFDQSKKEWISIPKSTKNIINKLEPVVKWLKRFHLVLFVQWKLFFVSHSNCCRSERELELNHHSSKVAWSSNHVFLFLRH